MGNLTSEKHGVPSPDGNRLWRGLEEYMDTPEFRASLENEFPEDAADWLDPVTRRGFLSLMGASIALAGAGCSVRPASERQITPYVVQPDQVTPGVPTFYATAMPLAGYSLGVLVRSHEGRPVKIEGNPDHPASLGGTDVFAQAAILDLYDPDRSKTVLSQGASSTYAAASSALRQRLTKLRESKGAGLRILTETVTSPTLADQIEGILKDFPEARWVQHDALGRENVRAGAEAAFGTPLATIYNFKAADVVLSLDGDFLGTGPGHTRYCRDFSSRRKVRQKPKKGESVSVDGMNRLYSVECAPSTVGSVADHRLPLPNRQIESFARALAAKLNIGKAPAAGPIPESAQAWLEPLANDLLAHKKKCVVVVGDQQPASLHALGHAINIALGSVGPGEEFPVNYLNPIEVRPKDKVDDLAKLTKDISEKKVNTLLILGGNPVYTAPVDLDFLTALKSVEFKAHLGLYEDETAVWCDWHIPEAHFLESWGDGRAYDGTATIMQPGIAPLYDGASAIGLLADITNLPSLEGIYTAKSSDPYEVVKSYWRGKHKLEIAGEFEIFWAEAVKKGVIATAEGKPSDPQLKADWFSTAPAAPAALVAGEFEINFRPDPTMFDGRFANNGWLQELPKPITKLTWDNAVLMSPQTAKKLNVSKEFGWTAGERGRIEVSVVEIEYHGKKIKGPVWIMPGHADGAITVHLGYGRERGGRVAQLADQLNAEGKLTRGFNAYALRRSDALWIDAGAKVTITGETYRLASVQANWSMSEKDPISGKTLDRKPVRRATVDYFKGNQDFAKMPPASVGEAHEIDANVPAPLQPVIGGSNGKGNLHEAHVHSSEGGAPQTHKEDKRLFPLTMYNDNSTLYPDARDPKRRWGMAIDLSACTGCNACAIACQSENNIPVVGKHEVTRAHEMHWIRIDRYYEGDPDNAGDLNTYFQPVPCQQCEKAPCEVVCPVGATVHSADGLNDMVYNRCVGTRYCSNNCPYKVRRFNFLTFQDWATESLKLGRNPDVSVRSRGVMEKCTYCVQRIRGAEIVAEREGRNINDGEVITACQAACPSGAIAFGDLNLEDAEVSHWKEQPTNYGLLAELNTMPRTTYLAVLRNPNPAMPKTNGKES